MLPRPSPLAVNGIAALVGAVYDIASSIIVIGTINGGVTPSIITVGAFK